jgi:hypothetical protein
MDKRIQQADAAIAEFLTHKPGARKSHNEFKPLIRRPDGTTEVADKAPMVRLEHRYARSRKRGAVFPTAEEATAFAQSVIKRRIEDQREYRNRIEAALANGATPMPI